MDREEQQVQDPAQGQAVRRRLQEAELVQFEERVLQGRAGVPTRQRDRHHAGDRHVWPCSRYNDDDNNSFRYMMLVGWKLGLICELLVIYCSDHEGLPGFLQL